MKGEILMHNAGLSIVRCSWVSFCTFLGYIDDKCGIM